MATTQSKLDVVYEDNHLLVLNKPSLLPTMGVEENQDSLVKQAKVYLRDKYNKPGNVFLGVVSRLDSHTSGLVIFARTSKAAKRLNEQFLNRTVEKTYLAIVPDSVSESGIWTDQLLKNESQHRMESIDEDHPKFSKAKTATLEFRKLESNTNICWALMEVNLLTGRKHQIRIQFASRGFPIIGDRKYNSPDRFEAGIALHSSFLRVEHPTRKEPLEFFAEPPSYWPFDRAIRHYRIHKQS